MANIYTPFAEEAEHASVIAKFPDYKTRYPVEVELRAMTMTVTTGNVVSVNRHGSKPLPSIAPVIRTRNSR